MSPGKRFAKPSILLIEKWCGPHLLLGKTSLRNQSRGHVPRQLCTVLLLPRQPSDWLPLPFPLPFPVFRFVLFVNDKVATGGYRHVKVLEFFDCPGPRQGVEDLRELLHKQRVKRMASMNTRLNIKKINGNIVQKHGGSKQVGFKQLGPGVETRVHEVHDENVFGLRWNCRELKGVVKLRFFRLDGRSRRVSFDFFNQRSTQQCTKSGVAKHLGVAVIQQQNGLVKETNVTLLAKVHCFLIQSGLSKVFWAEDTTMSTYLVNKVTIISDWN
nr:retrovirus-related Pol polyprotein from transposon TNT 1-94 [Tanacetum cinerariifolium]